MIAARHLEVQTLSRSDTILAGLDLSRLRGAEIGPLDRPLVPKTLGTVCYVDHCDTDSLKARWASDPAVDVSLLHVDAVWGRNSLRQALAASGALAANDPGLDYVVASHVVEHVPDLVAWLSEVHEVLQPDGNLRLIVPDKRYSFDITRRTTCLTDVLDAYVRKRRVPSASRVLDFALNMVHVDCAQAWRGSLQMDRLERGYSDEDAIALARDAEEQGTYHDVHCWVFTPASFAELMARIADCGLLPFACDWIVHTAPDTLEFFVAMKPSRDREQIRSSWQRAAAG